MERGRTRSVGSELHLLFRAITGVVVVLLALNIVPRLVLLGHVRPAVNKLRQMQSNLNQVRDGMVDEETGLRGYLATGSTAFLCSLPSRSTAGGVGAGRAVLRCGRRAAGA